MPGRAPPASPTPNPLLSTLYSLPSTVYPLPSTLYPLLFVFVAPLHPDERLQVDHVARAEVRLILTHLLGELQHADVGAPVRPRLVGELDAVLLRRAPGDHRLEEGVRLGLGDEPPDRGHRPGQSARLASRQGGDRLDPLLEALLVASAPVQEPPAPFGERLRA